MFQSYIDVVLTSWHALQFAVQHETGGPESYAISKWMNGVTEQFFHDNENLHPNELAEFLSTILDQELNTLVEDGSDLEISEILCQVYDAHKMANIDHIQNILSKLPKNNSPYNVQSESDTEDEVQACQVSNQISSMNLSSNGSDISDAPLSSVSATNGHTAADEDGWIMIKKNKRKTYD